MASEASIGWLAGAVVDTGMTPLVQSIIRDVLTAQGKEGLLKISFVNHYYISSRHIYLRLFDVAQQPWPFCRPVTF